MLLRKFKYRYNYFFFLEKEYVYKIFYFILARLRKPQDGLFTGVVDALDTVTNSYRITFDRPGIGTHSIPDYEVLVRKSVWSESYVLMRIHDKMFLWHMNHLFYTKKNQIWFCL